MVVDDEADWNLTDVRSEFFEIPAGYANGMSRMGNGWKYDEDDKCN